MLSEQLAVANPPLVERLSDSGYANRFTTIAASIDTTVAPASAVGLLREGVEALGAERGILVSVVRSDGGLRTCRFMLACDPGWCRDYLEAGGAVHDPWLDYATHHAEPVVASVMAQAGADSGRRQRVLDVCARHGFRSVVLAPVHSGVGRPRSSVLVLGSSTPGYFEEAARSDGFRLLRIGARMLAGQLHDWWLARVRDELLHRTHLTPTDLVLLRYEHEGRSSKQIVEALNLSKNAIDTRFHRINLKLGVPNRRSAAQVVFEAGLISG